MVKRQGKECRTTIRHSEEENVVYEGKAKKLGISKSEYIRLAVNGYSKGTTANVLESVCKLATICNQIVAMSDIDEEQKLDIERSAKEICQQLQLK